MKKYLSKCRGFTLAELLIVIVVIAVLAIAMIMASDEAVSSAKAATIISNLTNIKVAVNQWYWNNLSKVAAHDSNAIYYTANGKARAVQKGKIIIGNKIGSPQHYTGSELGLYNYFSGPIVLVNQVSGDYGEGVGQASSNLKPGNYGFYDAGTKENNSTPWNTLWLVGYCFKDDEEKVKEKIAHRSGTLDLLFTYTPDPWDRMNPKHENLYDNHKLKDIKKAQAVWIEAIDLEISQK